MDVWQESLDQILHIVVLIPIVPHAAHARVRDVVFMEPFMPEPRYLLSLCNKTGIIQAIIKTYYHYVKVIGLLVFPKPSG